MRRDIAPEVRLLAPRGYCRHRRVPLLVFVATAFACAAFGATADPSTTAVPQGKWREVVCDDGLVTLLLPGEPEQESKERWSLAGSIRSGKCQAELDGVGFRLEFHHLPLLARNLVSDDALLARAMTKFLEEAGGAERSRSAQTVEKWPARRLSYGLPSGQSGEALFILAAGRLYILVARPLPADFDAAALKRFFDSFALTER